MVVVVCIGVSWFYGAYIVYWVMVPADPGSSGHRAVKRVCVCCCVEQSRESLEPL